MYDNSLFFAGLAEKKKSTFLDDIKLERDKFILVTIHRDLNTDDTIRLQLILQSLKDLAEKHEITMLMPLHPRTINTLKSKLSDFFGVISSASRIRIVPPVSFLEMILLEKNCRLIVTDSGGVQKESHFFRKPCIVLRKETEWIELVNNGTAKLVDADIQRLSEEFDYFLNRDLKLDYPAFYGNGRTAEFILREILMLFEKE
jgi:UDP-GlcNAc3NAcA epimerase